MQDIDVASDIYLHPTQKEAEIIQEFNRLLPNVKIRSMRAGNSDSVNYSHFFISPENRDLYNSEYYYKEKSNLVHFTSLYSIESIIHSQCIRLYNLHNLNDPREFSFAGDLISYNRENKKDAKENLFLLSMCHPKILKGNPGIEFNMWRLYGNNGFGVAIEFSFGETVQENWRDHYLSNVFYGSDTKTKLKELNSLLKKHTGIKPHVTFDVGPILCFHKSNLFNLENEIRLLFDKRKKVTSATTYKFQERLLYPIERLDISKSSGANKEIKYVELPIYHQSLEEINRIDAIPLPKIEKIILGYQYRDKKIEKSLTELCKERLGYIPKIEKSRLTKYYHDIA